jgi:hypothetical protein
MEAVMNLVLTYVDPAAALGRVFGRFVISSLCDFQIQQITKYPKHPAEGGRIHVAH